MAALADAYNTYTRIDRASDLSRLIALAEYTAANWPDTDQGDAARLTLGQIYHGTGQYAKAIAAYEAVRASSPKWVEARTRAGGSHWELSQVLHRQAAGGAEAEVNKAIDTLKSALKARRDAGASATDPGLIGNACDLAEVDLETGRPAEALALLDPIARALAAPGRPAGLSRPLARVLAGMLRGHVAANQVDQALADMAALEQAGVEGVSLTQLYDRLGKLLDRELETLKKKGDRLGLERTRQAYKKFLAALVASKSGQTFETLQWAGENMLALGFAEDAGAIFDQILKTYLSDQAFLDRPGNRARLLRTQLKRAAAFRGQGDFAKAESLVEQLIRENPKTLDTLFERAKLLEDKAEAGKGAWSAAFVEWRNLAETLGKSRTKRDEYFEAWYHAASVLAKQGKSTQAKQTLKGVMRLSATLGSPEMKAKYLALLEQIK
jgi:tetratricopeptide (TPR) repeat protein